MKFKESELNDQTNSKSRLDKTRTTPGLLNSASKIFRSFQTSNKKKPNPETTEESTVDVSLMFQEQNIPKAAITAEKEHPIKSNENQKVEVTTESTTLLRIEDTICFESVIPLEISRRPIKYFYKGSTNAKRKIPAYTENRNKVNVETMTTEKLLKECSTQIDPLDMFDLHELETKLFDKIFDYLNDELLNETCESLIDEIDQRKKSNLVIEESILSEPNNIIADETTVYNDTACNNSVIFNETNHKTINQNNFSELLEASRVFPDDRFAKNRKIISKQAKKMPSLEFLNSKEASMTTSGRILAGKSIGLEPPIDKIFANNNSDKASSLATSNSIDESEESKKKYLIENNLIVVDTPVKDDNDEEYLKDLKITLSKSANRMEFADSRLLFNSTVPNMDEAKMLNSSEMTILYDKNETNKMEETRNDETIADDKGTEQTMAINQSESLEATVILENSVNHSIRGEIPINRKNIETHSFLFNSQNNSLNPMLALSTTFTNSTVHGQQPNRIPNAADFLGVSFSRDSLTFTAPINQSNHFEARKSDLSRTSNQKRDLDDAACSIIESTESEKETPNNKLMPIVTADVKKHTPTNDEETQILTDSELFVIDNICQDLYTTHNQTVDVRLLDLDTKSKSLPRKSLAISTISAKQDKKIEFVCSLLKADIKVTFR